jgi:hypothetical protein
VRFKGLCREAILPPRQNNKILPAEFYQVIKLKGGNKYREAAIEALRRLKAPKAEEDE